MLHAFSKNDVFFVGRAGRLKFASDSEYGVGLGVLLAAGLGVGLRVGDAAGLGVGLGDGGALDGVALDEGALDGDALEDIAAGTRSGANGERRSSRRGLTDDDDEGR